MSPDLVRAEIIKDGEWFVKNNGHYAYMRISKSSADFANLDPDKVHGVCFNGNMAAVRKGTLVHPATAKDYMSNVARDDARVEKPSPKPKVRTTTITIVEEIG